LTQLLKTENEKQIYLSLVLFCQVLVCSIPHIKL